MSAITYPNGQILTSSALTPQQMNVIFQPWTLGALGLGTGTLDYSLVRINWETQGQPFPVLPGQDVCFLSCEPVHTPYSSIRAYINSNAPPPLSESWTYNKGWHIAWILYGPNSSDRARMLWTAVFTDYFVDRLNASSLYPISEFVPPTRNPENINGEWWERADFAIDLYEYVTETLATPTGGIATSVVNTVVAKNALATESTISES